MMNMNRRKLVRTDIGAMAIVSANVAGRAVAEPPVDHDAPLHDAWARWLALREAYEAEPSPDVEPDELEIIEAPYWAAITAIQHEIMTLPARTPAGAEIKLRLALDTTFGNKHDNEALLHGDYDAMELEGVPWEHSLFVDILRDLSAMSARLGA